MVYATLARAVDEDAALRRKQMLQPVGGRNDKIFPPTYPEERRGQGPRHVFERRRLNGREAWCAQEECRRRSFKQRRRSA
jgi:CRISPR-associated protein Csb1